jgi:hypothetical protein
MWHSQLTNAISKFKSPFKDIMDDMLERSSGSDYTNPLDGWNEEVCKELRLHRNVVAAINSQENKYIPHKVMQDMSNHS